MFGPIYREQLRTSTRNSLLYFLMMWPNNVPKTRDLVVKGVQLLLGEDLGKDRHPYEHQHHQLYNVFL
jgi:hypothetical protein